MAYIPNTRLNMRIVPTTMGDTSSDAGAITGGVTQALLASSAATQQAQLNAALLAQQQATSIDPTTLLIGGVLLVGAFLVYKRAK